MMSRRPLASRAVYAAKWSVAQCLRSMGRMDEALAIEKALEAEGYKP